MENRTAEPLFLLCDEENLFVIDLYTVDTANAVRHGQTGYYRPYVSRFFANNQFTLPIGTSPQTLYIGIWGDASLLASFYIASNRGLAAWLHINDVFEGVFLGWMAVMFAFNLFLFFQLRDRVYLLYCLYIITSTFVAIREE